MTETTNFGRFALATEENPALELAKGVRKTIGESVDGLIKAVRGHDLQIDACDGAYKVEAAIYEWIKSANPDHPAFVIAEELGRAHEAGERPLASLTPAKMVSPVDRLIAAAWAAEDRLGVVIECDNEDHGGAAEDDVAAFLELREALKPFPHPRNSEQGGVGSPHATPFEQFVASGREVSDLSAFVPDVVRGQAGFLYDAGLYIERHNGLYLRLGNQEFVDVPFANKHLLEAILYEWSVADGARKDESREQSAASKAAHHICSFTTQEQRTRATLTNLRELTPGVCRVQGIADAWTILDQVAEEGTNLELAYELMRGLLALD